MRAIVATLIVFGWTAAGLAQTEAPARYGVPLNTERFSLASPNATLTTVIQLLESERYDYLAAHVIEPSSIDAQVAKRYELLLPAAEKELELKREFQANNPAGVTAQNAIPLIPSEFQAMVQQLAQQRAFRAVVNDIKNHLTEYPQHVRTLKTFARIGQVNGAGDQSEITLADKPNTKVQFQRGQIQVAGKPLEQWYMLNTK